MRMVQEKQKRKFIDKLRNKYKLVILNDETYEEKLSFRLSRLNVFVLTGIVTILLILLTTFLIAFTPLKEYIPGYPDVTLYEKLYRLQGRADSLEVDARVKAVYLENLKRILQGNDTNERLEEPPGDMAKYDDIKISRSREDSILRSEYETQNKSGNYLSLQGSHTGSNTDINSFSFFTPMRGIITSKFNPREKHFGIDVVAVQNEAIKATLDGVVVFTGWTLETGYVIGIQHSHDLFSVYKHNSALLKEQGAFVKAGDPIAIVGSSGELSTGPHLHFELWYNGTPVNPADFMIF
jgi:murein DD-endopeptidase MepM/ murein hydrolase activator NlpD